MSGQRSHAVAPSGPAGLALSAISPDVPDVWADIDDNDIGQENRYAHQLWGQIECSSSVPDSDSSNKDQRMSLLKGVLVHPQSNSNSSQLDVSTPSGTSKEMVGARLQALEVQAMVGARLQAFNSERKSIREASDEKDAHRAVSVPVFYQVRDAHAGLDDLGIVTGGYDDDEGIGAVQHSAYKIPSAEQSSLHAAGQCSPCRFLFSKKGCQIGSECKYCHMPHEKPTKSRPSRDKRARCKKFADALDADPDTRVYTAEQLSAMGTYLQKIVDSKCRRGNTTAVKDKSTKVSL